MYLWERKLALTFAVAAGAICVGITSCPAKGADIPYFQLSDPICQTGWTISQEYLERNHRNVVIRRVWIRRCVTPVIHWRKR